MGAKSRGNFPIGINVSQEDWNKWFPKKEKKKEDKNEPKKRD